MVKMKNNENETFENWFQYLIDTCPELCLNNTQEFRSSSMCEMIEFCFLSGLTLYRNDKYNQWMKSNKKGARNYRLN